MTKAPVAAATEKRICFVISPIGDDGSPVRKRSDQLLKHIIKHVLETAPFNFDVTRADDIQKPGLISQQVIELAIDAPLVVADLTDYNPNVLYELAIRHAAHKPVIHMIRVGQKIPFDIADQRTIYYDTEIGPAEEARVKLAQQVEAVLDDPTAVDNPISVARQLWEFKQSRNPVEQGIARILDEVSGIRAFMVPVVTTTAQTQKEKVNRLIGEALYARPVGGAFMVPTVEQMLWNQPVVRWGPDTICANCGQPIGSPVTVLRSSDSKPIHPPGQCPQPFITPQGTPST